MTPSTIATVPIQKTVFDLTIFDDVKLVKNVTLPTKPTTLAEAQAAVGNDMSKLLNVIHEGLIELAKETARADMTGFCAVDEDGNVATEQYSGQFADEAKGKLINNTVLAIAKMNGFDKTLPPARKTALKDDARAMLRENPKMLAGLVGSPAATE